MLDKNNLTASEIYTLVRYDYTSRDEAVKAIENYGLRKQLEYAEKIKNESSEIAAEMKQRFNAVNERLDEILKMARIKDEE